MTDYLAAAAITTLSRLRWADPPLDPGPDEGRRLAEQELARPEYHNPRSVVEQVLGWLRGERRRLNPETRFSGDGSLANVLLIGLGVGLLVLVIAVLLNLRRDPVLAAAGRRGIFDEEELLPPEQYLARARAALANGDFDAALLDAFRALTSRSAERTLLDEAPSLTAHEVGTTLSRPFPDHAGDLRRFADAFDHIRYGSGHATEADARWALATEAAVARTRPRLRGTADAGPAAGPLVAPGSPAPEEEQP